MNKISQTYWKVNELLFEIFDFLKVEGKAKSDFYFTFSIGIIWSLNRNFFYLDAARVVVMAFWRAVEFLMIPSLHGYPRNPSSYFKFIRLNTNIYLRNNTSCVDGETIQLLFIQICPARNSNQNRIVFNYWADTCIWEINLEIKQIFLLHFTKTHGLYFLFRFRIKDVQMYY